MKGIFSKMDRPLLLIMIILSILGLVMVFSASSVAAVLRYGVSSNYFFIRQLFFVLTGFIGGFAFIIRIPTKKYKIFAPLLTIGVVASLVGLFAYGYVSNGAQSWYDFKYFSIQPLEFAKTILVMFMAVFYGALVKKKRKDPYASLIPLGIGAMIAFLVLMQPDLGGALIIGGIAFLIFLSVPLQKSNKQKVLKVIGIGVVIVAIFLTTSGKTILNSYQLNRLEFRNPCSRYMENSGYQVCNGFIAINNGGLWGVGLGNSTQKYLYLPEAHTDFVFAIIVEELGLVLSIFIILGYIAMLYRMLKIAKEADNLRNSILAYGGFIMVLLHVLVNLLGSLAIMPLTGVPLPLLSYGGSSTVNVLIMIFIVQRVAIENKLNKAKRELVNL